MHRLAEILALRNRTLKLWEVLLFCVVAGILSTLLHGYEYMTSDQLEQLPLILRKIDASYLANDHFISVMSEVSPRIYFVNTMAWLAQVASLESLYFWLTCFQHLAIALVTMYAARRMFPGGDLAPILGTTLVLSVAAIYVGGTAHLVMEFMLPKSLMLFLALWAAWEGVNLRPFRCAILSIIGSLFHPQVAMHGAIIGFGTSGVSLLTGWGRQPASRKDLARRWIGIVAAGLLLVIAYYFLWVIPLKGAKLSMNLLHYSIRFRGPHHHIPSLFPTDQLLFGIVFFAASAFLWYRWIQSETADKSLVRRVGIAGSIMLVLFFCAWLFVEVIPLRPFMIIQSFRMVSMFKWLGLILLGGAVATLLLNRQQTLRPSPKWLYLTAVGMGQPVMMMSASVVDWLRAKVKSIAYVFVFTLAALIQVALLIKFRGVRELLSLYAILSCGLILLILKSEFRRWLWSGGIVVAALLLALIFRDGVQAGALNKLVQSYVHGVTPKDEREFDQAVDRVSVFARENTPQEAMFIVPPEFGRFRIVARRAVVVDFKTFPFYERDILEWRERIETCYGDTGDKMGWEAVKQMNENYRRMTDAELLRISNRYNAPYAVLCAGTPTTFSVIYEEKDFKIVAIR